MIGITNTIIEDKLKNLLQHNIVLSVNNKKWKQGHFVLFKQNNFYIELYMKSNKKLYDKFDIPIPFNITDIKDGLMFSYKLEHLSQNKEDILQDLIKIKPLMNCRFYDKYIEIKIA